jgi:hypothetical protein
MGWFEIWNKGFQRRLRRKNVRKLPADLMHALRSDLAQIAGSPVYPEPDPTVQETSAKGRINKADGESSRKGIHLVSARRGTRRADRKSAE